MRGAAALVAAGLLVAGCVGGCAGGGARGASADGPAAREGGPELEVVVGASGAVVTDRRRVDVPADGEVRFPGVPPLVDVGSVRWRSLTDGEGTRSVAQRLVPAGAEGATRATLVWRVRTKRPGPQLIEVTYRTAGLSWQATYTVVIDDAAGMADVAAQVEIDDRSGAGFADARVLVARGDAAVAPALPAPAGPAPAPSPSPKAGRALAPRLYALPARVTLVAGARTHVALFPARRVPARRALVYDAVGAAGVWTGAGIKKDASFPEATIGDVRAFLEIENDPGSGLGVAMPAGLVRFFRREGDGRLVWLADEHVGDVVVGQRLRVPLGIDGELSGARRQISVDLDDERRRLVEEIEITLSNRGAQARDVTVIERLARSDHWRLTWWTAEPEKDDARGARFRVSVPAGGTKKIRYRVMYLW